MQRRTSIPIPTYPSFDLPPLRLLTRGRESSIHALTFRTYRVVTRIRAECAAPFALFVIRRDDFFVLRGRNIYVESVFRKKNSRGTCLARRTSPREYPVEIRVPPRNRRDVPIAYHYLY